MLKTENLHFEYGGLKVLQDISFEVEKGQLCALFGPNGTGKTTLLNIVGMLDRPSSGRVVIDETDITQLSESECTRLRSTLIGYVFQGDSIVSHMTAEQNIMLPGIIRDERRTLLKEKALAWLKRLGLEHRAKTKGVYLSGGEKQRIAIARELFTTPRILIADEPTTFLDERNRELIISVLREAHNDGATILYTTHHEGERGDIALVLDAGTIASMEGSS